jgi:hypothetical protein
MTKLFSGLLALSILAFSFGAEAGWNLRQNDDGTTEWVRTDTADTQDTRTVGAVYLTVLLENISAESTAAVAIPVTDAKVSYIQSVMFGDITTADAVLDFWIGDSDGDYSTEITNGTGRMTLTAIGGSEEGIVDTFTPTGANTAERNQTVYIHTNGGSTNDVDAVITITIIPR